MISKFLGWLRIFKGEDGGTISTEEAIDTSDVMEAHYNVEKWGFKIKLKHFSNFTLNYFHFKSNNP
jgi:hypothetical protein